MIKTPDAPATSRQLWKLHTLTGEDTRDINMTMQEAHNKIKQLENGRIYKWQEIPLEWEASLKIPMNFADVRLFFGDPGSGKSMSTVACVIDDVFNYVTHVVTPEGEMIKANALNEEEQMFLEAPQSKGGMGIRYNHLRHMRIFNDDGTKSKIVKIPTNYTILSPVKVFANRTFYGIRYAPFDLESFMQYINTPLFTNGWIVLTESVLLGKEDWQSYVARFLRWFGATCRIRHMHMAVDMQYRNQLAPLFHLLATTNVECSYDPDTTIVTLDVNESSPVMTSTSYVSHPYQKFYRTDELPQVPQYRIDKAMQSIRGE